MPELPEVETVRAGLHDRLRGRVLETVEQRRADLRIPFPPRFAARLRGRHLDRIARRGKYLLWHFCGGPVLIAHLGMSGRWVLRDDNGAPPLPHEHVVLTFAGGAVACYRDPRRFGLMTLAADEDLAAHPLLADMGPEPLTPAFDGAVLARAFRGRRAPVKSLLLDQRVVAGLGNIYACEALFRAGIAPDRAAGRLRADRTLRLADSVREVLADAITAGGSSLRDYVQSSGELGYFQHQWRVYGKEGRPCGRCRAGARCRVQRAVQAGRSTFWCPRWQR